MRQSIYRVVACVAIMMVLACCACGAATPPQPHMLLKLDVARAIEGVRLLAPPEVREQPEFKAQLASLSELDLSKCYLFVYPDEEFESLPVLLVSSADTAALQRLFAPGGVLEPYVEKVKETLFKLTPMATAAGAPESASDIPLDQYRIWVTKKLVILAPLSIARSWSAGAVKPMASAVARTAAALESKDHALVCAVQIPADIAETAWDEVADALPLPEGDSAVVTDVGSNILADLSESLSAIESLAFGVHVTSETNRVVEYRQLFRQDAALGDLVKLITGATEAGGATQELLALLISVIKSEPVTMSHSVEGRSLSLQLSWAQADDQAVVESVAGYLMGRLMSAAMGGGEMTMSSGEDDGPVVTKYQTEPRFEAVAAVGDLAGALEREMGQRLFRYSYFNHGDEPKMTMALDPLELPNTELMEIEYSFAAVTSADGSSIMRAEDRDVAKWGARKIQPGHGSQIQFPVLKGTKQAQLGAGTLHVKATVPASIEIVEFSKDEIGVSKGDPGRQVSLRSIANNQVSVAYSGAEQVRLVAYDATGGCLSSSSSMWSGGSISTSFHGFPERVKVVSVIRKQSVEFDLTCAFADGNGEKLGDEPTADVRVRYERDKVKRYHDYTRQELESLQVAWQEASGNEWKDKLSVALPGGRLSGSTMWDVHFLGATGPFVLEGDSTTSGGELSYDVDKGELAKAVAAVGSLTIKADHALQTLLFEKGAAGASASQTLPSGRQVSVAFDKNGVTIEAGGVKVLTLIASDDAGRRLKPKDWSFRDGLNLFWGLPARVELVIADGTIEQAIPIAIRPREVTDERFLAFQQRAQAVNAAIRTLKQLVADTRRIRSSSEYDDTVAGFYYLYDGKGIPRTEKAISEAMAHADPAGVERYGYTLKPYGGYTFSRLKGKIDNAGQKVPNRVSSRTRTYKWAGGEFELAPLSTQAGFVANPVDTSLPAITIVWSEVYLRDLDGEPIEYLESSLRDTEWKKF